MGKKIGKEIEEKLNNRIIETFLVAYAFEIDSKRSIHFFIENSLFSLIKPLKKQAISELYIQTSRNRYCLVINFPLKGKIIRHIADIYNRHYPSSFCLVEPYLIDRATQPIGFVCKNILDFIRLVIPSMDKLTDTPSKPLNSEPTYIFHKKDNLKRPVHKLPPELEKNTISFDQLDFVGDEKPNSAMIDFGGSSAIYRAKLYEEEVAVKFYLVKTSIGDDQYYFPIFLHEASLMNSFKSSQKSCYFVDFKSVTYRPDVGYGIVMERYPQSLFMFLQNDNDMDSTLELKFKWALNNGSALVGKNRRNAQRQKY